MIITLIICITIVICFFIGSITYYRLKINKEYTVRVKDAAEVVNVFRSSYIDGDFHCGDKGKNFKGNTVDIMNLIRTLNKILNLGLWNL